MRPVAGLSPRRPTFFCCSVRLRFLVDKVVLQHAFFFFSSPIPVSPVSSIPPLLLPGGKKGETWGLQTNSTLSEIWEHWVEMLYCFCLQRIKGDSNSWFELIMALTIKNVFLAVTPCSSVALYWRFARSYCLHVQGSVRFRNCEYEKPKIPEHFNRLYSYFYVHTVYSSCLLFIICTNKCTHTHTHTHTHIYIYIYIYIWRT